MLCVACSMGITHTSLKHVFNHWEKAVASEGGQVRAVNSYPESTPDKCFKVGAGGRKGTMKKKKKHKSGNKGAGLKAFDPERTEKTERRGWRWRLAPCLAPLPGMCHHACQQSQRAVKSSEWGQSHYEYHCSVSMGHPHNCLWGFLEENNIYRKKAETDNSLN